MTLSTASHCETWPTALFNFLFLHVVNSLVSFSLDIRKKTDVRFPNSSNVSMSFHFDFPWIEGNSCDINVKKTPLCHSGKARGRNKTTHTSPSRVDSGAEDNDQQDYLWGNNSIYHNRGWRWAFIRELCNSINCFFQWDSHRTHTCHQHWWWVKTFFLNIQGAQVLNDQIFHIRWYSEYKKNCHEETTTTTKTFFECHMTV